jgi:hypothetical protein
MSEHKLPKTKLVQPTESNKKMRDEVINVIKKYSDNIEAIEILAILAYTVGQTVAMQDQRKYTSDTLMLLISQNIEAGNKHVIDSLLGDTKGNA